MERGPEAAKPVVGRNVRVDAVREQHDPGLARGIDPERAAREGEVTDGLAGEARLPAWEPAAAGPSQPSRQVDPGTPGRRPKQPHHVALDEPTRPAVAAEGAAERGGDGRQIRGGAEQARVPGHAAHGAAFRSSTSPTSTRPRSGQSCVAATERSPSSRARASTVVDRPMNIVAGRPSGRAIRASGQHVETLARSSAPAATRAR